MAVHRLRIRPTIAALGVSIALIAGACGMTGPSDPPADHSRDEKSIGEPASQAPSPSPSQSAPSQTESGALPRIPPVPGLRGRLAFDNFLDVFVLDLATGEVDQLTNAPGPDQNPVWSPDGRRIAFRSRRDGNDEIYLMDADGSNQDNLTRSEDQDEWGPTWSPDGEWLAFNASVEERASLRLYVVRPDGTDGHFLGTSYAEFPAWSSDGRRIAFASMPPGQAGINPNYDIRIIDVDGTRGRQLTDTPTVMELVPQWSPDGSQIAFMAGPVGMAMTAVWVMQPNGRDRQRLTEGSGAVPAWSPDGSRIVYVEIGRDVMVMNADGSDPVELGLSRLEFAELGFVSWAP